MLQTCQDEETKKCCTKNHFCNTGEFPAYMNATTSFMLCAMYCAALSIFLIFPCMRPFCIAVFLLIALMLVNCKLSALKLVGCGFDLQPSHPKDSVYMYGI